MPMLNQIPAIGAMLLFQGTGYKITWQLLLHKVEFYKGEVMLRYEEGVGTELTPYIHNVSAADFD